MVAGRTIEWKLFWFRFRLTFNFTGYLLTISETGAVRSRDSGLLMYLDLDLDQPTDQEPIKFRAGQDKGSSFSVSSRERRETIIASLSLVYLKWQREERGAEFWDCHYRLSAV
jgi:hypothetical protein